MIQHLLGCGVLSGVNAAYRDAERRDLRLEFDYRHAAGEARVTCELITRERPPRPASYAINGRWVHRSIALPGYEIFFEAEGRKVRIEDPLTGLIRRFLGRVRDGAPVDRDRLVEGIRGLEVLFEAVRKLDGAGARDDGEG